MTAGRYSFGPLKKGIQDRVLLLDVFGASKIISGWTRKYFFEKNDNPFIFLIRRTGCGLGFNSVLINLLMELFVKKRRKKRGEKMETAKYIKKLLKRPNKKIEKILGLQ